MVSEAGTAAGTRLAAIREAAVNGRSITLAITLLERSAMEGSGRWMTRPPPKGVSHHSQERASAWFSRSQRGHFIVSTAL